MKMSSPLRRIACPYGGARSEKVGRGQYIRGRDEVAAELDMEGARNKRTPWSSGRRAVHELLVKALGSRQPCVCWERRRYPIKTLLLKLCKLFRRTIISL